MRGFALLFMIGIFCQAALAASPSDFYCSEAIQAQKQVQDGSFVPVVTAYGTHVKSCDGKSFSEDNLCSMVVKCAWIPDEIKATAKRTLLKDFSKLSEFQKKELMKYEFLNHSVLSVLSCQGKSTPAGITCPIPEKCKGDVLYNVQEASLDGTDGQGNLDRVRSGNPDTFQTNTDPTPATDSTTTSGSAGQH